MPAKRHTRRAGPSDWIIAIPSYRRATTLRDKTLQVLRDYKIPRNRIHVFVADAEEAAIYRATLDPATYGHLHIAEPGMAAVRNFITRFFPVGKPIFNIDDDIRGFLEWSATTRRHERPLRDLSAAITAGFAAARRTGYRLFGFYAVPNGFFMKGGPPSTELRYVAGGAWGILNPGPVLNLTLDDKEDYLRSVMMYILDGGVLRYNNIAPMTAGYAGLGGMQETRTLRRIDASARQLVRAFPELVTLNLTKKSGKPEVRLRDSRPEAERRFGPEVLKEHTLPTL